MDLLAFISSSTVPKIAIFLLFFALVALIFEIFYFRRRRAKEPVVQESSASVIETSPHRQSRMKKNLIILGVVLVVLALPVSLYVAFQPVKVEKEAQVTQPQLIYACDKVDILRNGVLVEPSSILANDTVTFVGYCYAEGGSSATGNINRLRFSLTRPGGSASSAVYLAFPATDKNIANRSYFKASYPNVKLVNAGAYSIQVSAYDRTTALTPQAFSRSFTVSAGSISTPPVTATATPRVTATPTPRSVGTSQNVPPTCLSLSAIPLTGPAPLTVSLTASGTDTDGKVNAFEIMFGDDAKQTANVATPSASASVSLSHVYQSTGSYKAQATARDNSGNVSVGTPSCQTTISVTSSSQATTSAQLKAQPTKIPSPTPTLVSLPQAGISLPMVGFVSAGLLLLTFGLLLAF